MARTKTQRARRALRRARSRSRSRVRPSTPFPTNPKTTRLAPTATSMFRPARDFRITGEPQEVVGSVPLPVPRFRGRRGRRRGIGAATQPDVPQVVSAYVDPFSEEARGVKYPDAYHGLTFTFDVESPLFLQTNPTAGTLTDLNQVAVTPASGQSLALYTPDPSNCVIQGISGSKAAGPFTGAPNVFYWPNGISFTNAPGSANAFGPGTGIINFDNTVPSINTLRLAGSAARLVSGGIKITATQNFSTVSGTIHVAPVFVNMARMTTTGGAATGGPFPTTAFEQLNGWQPALPANLPAMAQLPGYQQYPMSSLENDELVVIFKRVGTEAYLFKPTTTAWGCDDNDTANLATRYGDADVPDNVGHLCILVYIEGALSNTGGALPAATTLAEVLLTHHLEVQPQPDTAALSNTGTQPVVGGLLACAESPPYQPLLVAAADNLASDVPAVRVVDDAGVEEGSFMSEVYRLWGLATKIVTSVGPVVDVVGPLLAAMVL